MQSDWSDEGLVLRAQEGDLRAFDALASLCRAHLTRLAGRELNDESHAEDLVQEALLAAYKNLDQLDDPALFSAWLSAILRRRAWRWNQQDRPQPLELNELDRLLLSRSCELARGIENRQEVEAAVSSLSIEDQEMLKMAAGDGMSTAEMSLATGLTETTVKWRLHSARRRARTALEDEQ